MNFQEQLEKDLDSVFFNSQAKEFVTTHRIAGIRGEKASVTHECAVVVDYELYKERNISSDSIENITLDGLIFFVKKESWASMFNNAPKINSALMFDEKRFTIESVNDDMGMFEVTLSSHRG